MTVLIHLTSEDPIVAEIERLPEPDDQILVCENPRRKDGRDVGYLLAEVRSVLLPWHRIHCVEVLPTQEKEEVITFVRD